MDSLYDDGPAAEPPEPSRRTIRTTHPARRVMATAALAAGMAAGGYGIAHAATNSTSTNSSGAAASTPSQPRFNPLDGNHAGPGETLLTGDAAAKATAAAKAAVPGGTIIRVETDADQGAKYEAHMKKSDGSYVTVLMDANFKVTAIDAFGP